jgi:hypothetical protein
MTEKGPAIWCPGCGNSHVFDASETPTSKGAKWSWDGNVDKPTFAPSMVILIGTMVKPGLDARNADNWEYKTICHSFVRAGRIEFLGDCTHALVGQTVDLPDWPPL